MGGKGKKRGKIEKISASQASQAVFLGGEKGGTHSLPRLALGSLRSVSGYTTDRQKQEVLTVF